MIPERTILFSSKNILNSVFDSTVMELLKAIKYSYPNIKLSLIIFKGNISDHEQGMIFRRKLEDLENLISKEDLLLIDKRSLQNLGTHIKHVEFLIERHRKENTVLLCQNYYTSFIGSIIKKRHPEVHFHASLRGVVPEEHLFYGKSNLLINSLHYFATKYFERRFLKRIDSISVVSNKFKSYLINKYAIDRPIVVFPTLFNHTIFYFDKSIQENTRKELGIQRNEVLLTYSGSFQKWQNPDIIFKLCSKVLDKLSNYKLLIITYDRKKAKQLINCYHIPENKVFVKTGAPAEVNKWLNASDVCLLLRKDDLVNQVASPTKFLEYLVTKNKIIMTDNIGDYSDIIKSTEYGLVAQTLSIDTLFNLLANIDDIEYPTDDFINLIIDKYSMERNIETLISCFDN